MERTLVTMDLYAIAVERLSKFSRLVVDTETTGLNVWGGDCVVGVSIKGKGDDQAFYFPFRHGDKYGPSGNLPEEKLQPLIDLIGDSKVENVTGFNWSYDSKMLYQEGLPLSPKFTCVMLAAHLMNENEPSLKLKKLAARYVDPTAGQAEEKLNEKARSLGLDPKSEMWKLPASEVYVYACDDVILTDKLEDFYIPHLETWKILQLWRDVCLYQYNILEMEISGMPLNMELMEQYIVEADKKIEESTRALHVAAGYPINPRSPKQLQAWLGLESTAAEVLEILAPKRPEVKLVLENRWWSRCNSNYYHPFQTFMDLNCVLHPNLNLIGTETGRCSASKPPMQAIPVRDEVYKVKDVFPAGEEEDDVYIEADYGQAELRVASHYGDERTMAEKLERGADIHTETANEINIPRPAGKQLNFSVIYGIGAKTLSERLRIPLQLAKQYLAKYHGMYPGFRRLYNRCEALAADRGYIRMFTGRMRHYNVPTAYTHKASSNLVQGGVAEMIRIAIMRCAELRDRAPMKLQVHDSLLFKSKKQYLPEIIPEIKKRMENQAWCSVSQKVDIKVGRDWGHMEKYDE